MSLLDIPTTTVAETLVSHPEFLGAVLAGLRKFVGAQVAAAVPGDSTVRNIYGGPSTSTSGYNADVCELLTFARNLEVEKCAAVDNIAVVVAGKQSFGSRVDFNLGVLGGDPTLVALVEQVLQSLSTSPSAVAQL
ncbi:unnamed protein product, partial [Amoebophrya sp. A25]